MRGGVCPLLAVVVLGACSGATDTGDAASPMDALALDVRSDQDDGGVPDPDAASERVDANGDVDAPAPMPDASCACDDGVACTVDSCAGMGCDHIANHAECPEGQYCEATSGCRLGGPCASVRDCTSPDPCAIPQCDISMRRCIYTVLDGDRDGEAPLICGGTDCDDASATVSSSRTEVCNGADDDCDTLVDEDDAEGGTACGDRSTCIEGACVCELAGGWCDRLGFDGRCVDLSSDPTSCGVCGRVCEPGRACVDGECECDTGLRFCVTEDLSGAVAGCTDTNVDPSNCGGCDRHCPDGVACVDGTCACPSGQDTCGGTWGDPAICTDLSSDRLNCGFCGVQCPTGVSCVAGRCACPGGVFCSSLGDRCVDLETDEEHCGRCARACTGGTCRAGDCSCGAGQTACAIEDGTGTDYGTSCVDLMTNPSSCGACGRSCGRNRTCSDGRCAGCSEGFTDCLAREGPSCVDLNTDSEHCGRCGGACAWPTHCERGRCVR